jgi:hypothetical protein
MRSETSFPSGATPLISLQARTKAPCSFRSWGWRGSAHGRWIDRPGRGMDIQSVGEKRSEPSIPSGLFQPISLPARTEAHFSIGFWGWCGTALLPPTVQRLYEVWSGKPYPAIVNRAQDAYTPTEEEERACN